MKVKFSELLFQKVPVVGILRGHNIDTTLQCIQAYADAGFSNIEVTMNTPNVTTILKASIEKHSGKLNIGVGTVCNTEELGIALSTGAQFIVSPITDTSMIEICVSKEIPIFPGAYSPSEIYQAWSAGARMVKLFPASDLGPSYVKDVLAPLNQVEIMTTGGISLENIAEYKNAGVKAFGMGSLLFNKDLIKSGDWNGLTEHLLRVKEAIQ